ncbi:MAG: phage terminase small subunit P27 family [Flavobacteriales bacterium]|nr:phage terminase small subunit P27 family [Flavobacteriales bacterium]
MGKRGIPPQPEAVARQKGYYRPSRHGQSNEHIGVNPISTQNIPQPPEDLGADAAVFWNRMIYEMSSLEGWITTLDLAAFGLMCESFAECKALKCSWKKAGRTFTDRNGTIKPNPVYKMWQDQERQLKAWMQEFGITPSARTRINVIQPKVKDEFDECYL